VTFYPRQVDFPHILLGFSRKNWSLSENSVGPPAPPRMETQSPSLWTGGPTGGTSAPVGYGTGGGWCGSQKCVAYACPPLGSVQKPVAYGLDPPGSTPKKRSLPGGRPPPVKGGVFTFFIFSDSDHFIGCWADFREIPYQLVEAVD